LLILQSWLFVLFYHGIRAEGFNLLLDYALARSYIIILSLFYLFSYLCLLMQSYAMAVQGTRIPQVEPTDPLFIHPSDNPAQPLVSNPFNGENYDGWKRSVTIALSARHKIAFIDGSCECPAATTPQYSLWQRNNAMVLSWLLNSLNDNVRNSVLYFDTAKALWDDLEGRFGQSNKARLFQVQKDIVCLSQGDLDIVSYYTKAKQLWDEAGAVSNIPRCTCAKCECGVNGKLCNYTEEQRLI